MFSPRRSISTPSSSRSLRETSLRRTPMLNKKSKNLTPRKTRDSFVNSNFGNEILEETSQHKIASFGSSLPVLIRETLALSDRKTSGVSASIDPSGWAWLVGGRKLFVWRYVNDSNSRVVVCKELTLPPSDLAHSAERVCVIPSQQGLTAACVAVSPEGVVRYWPNIAFETSTTEISAELKGEECAQVINFQPCGCLLATTTSSLTLLELTPGQPGLTCRLLNSPGGLFSGVSRRMSSFIFGASPSIGVPLQAILAGKDVEYDDSEDEGRSFYTLSGPNLSKWFYTKVGAEKMLYQVDVERLFKDSFTRKVWEQDSVHTPQLKTWLLDIQIFKKGLLVLGACVDPEGSQEVHFGLAYIETETQSQPQAIEKLTVLNYSFKYSKSEENRVLSHKLLVPSNGTDIFIYTETSILMLQDESTLDQMDLKTQGDSLLGIGSCDGTAVFFSNAHGIFSVTSIPQNSFLEESMGSQVTKTDISNMVASVSSVKDLAESDDNKSKLMAAFLASLSGEIPQSEKMVSELKETLGPQYSIQGSELDSVVAEASKDLINDVPSEDPRWADSGRTDSNSISSSVFIIQQLKDKQKAHNLFVEFLKRFSVWEELKSVQTKESIFPTSLLLCENMEKLEAAIALRELHSEYQKLVDMSIKEVLEKRRERVPPTLAAQDVFYRLVSDVEQILLVMVEQEKQMLITDRRGHELLTFIQAVNAIIVGMLHHALKYRQTNSDSYVGNTENVSDYIPWTNSTAIRGVLVSQISLNFDKGLPEARDMEGKGILYQSIVGLVDILMDGYASQVNWMKKSSAEGVADLSKQCSQLEQQFVRERQKWITLLVEQKQYDRAASLAEKYEDFEMLMRICDATNNRNRLEKYCTQYADKEFSQFMCSWYMKEGKRGQLLSQHVCQGEKLSKFLAADNVKYLSWLHDINTSNFRAAHSTLSELASEEKNFLAKKKTLLSLSKLSALASSDDVQSNEDDIEVINEELELILHQELLPKAAVTNVGMDPDNMRVLSPEELIELYVSENNTEANELDVKKALDLLGYVSPEKHDKLRLHIWCRSLMMDSWEDDPSSDPSEIIQEKIFFKTLNMIQIEETESLSEMVPDLNTLFSSDLLGSLGKNSNFQYFMRAGYEQMQIQ